MDDGMRVIIRRILDDIRVELSDEFDRNFEREAFFSEAWQRRCGAVRRGGHLLVDSGSLRRSIRSRTTDSSILFFSDLPYAGIHNDGGEIVVTSRMKAFFWHKYYEASGRFGRKKNGDKRNDKRTLRLTEDAEFWKWMALKKVGSKIRIPRRRFLGVSAEVERAVREIIEENLRDFFENEYKWI